MSRAPLLALVTGLTLHSAGATPLVTALVEQSGCRMTRVDYTTAEECPTRVLLIDGGTEIAMRASSPGATRSHRITLPLARGRTLRYSILLPGGFRTPPRPLRQAAFEPPAIECWQEAREDGALELKTSASEPARWSFALRRGQDEERHEDGSAASSPVARFQLPGIGADSSLESIAVRAEFLDCERSIETGPVLGSKRLAKTLVDGAAVAKLDSVFQSLLATGGSAATFDRGPRARLRESGLPELMRAAARRMAPILADRMLDPEQTRLPLSLVLGQLRAVDRVAIQRGWPPPIGGDATDWTRPGEADQVPSDSVSLLAATTTPVLLDAWPAGTLAAIVGLSHARLTFDSAVAAVGDSVAQRARLAGDRPRPPGRSLVAFPWTAELNPMAGGPRRATLFLDVESLGPATMLFLRVNDQVMVEFGPSRARSGFLSCEVPVGLFHPGSNAFVAVALELRRGAGPRAPVVLKRAFWSPGGAGP